MNTKTPKEQKFYEIQRTFWFEVTRLASFLKSKRLLRWTDKKVIYRTYENGKLIDEICFDYKKVMNEAVS